ncbi:hypothetical protein CALVIDRAFT_542569 [Calocera viscosa TUFC12733]|uniref:Xylanolytic transcriptional activator regulatory domain-containing protein n=1 Tax=Calocera viscosa (strain TUFC12733) TaxID=1330018 RepID=A0A167GGC3_CALVF|nr:hypothetical protein CALVIDRAFT_542569 [Calocera viscosa TUFC12733]
MIAQALREPEGVPPGVECLIFSIYYLAVISLGEEERKKQDLPVKWYHERAEQALERARFTETRDMVVLQAFVLYLLALRRDSQSDRVWLLTGIATRLARRMGLHDESKSEGCSVFEAEMRRQLWWAMLLLDARPGERGEDVERTISVDDFNVRFPLNVNDSDLDPTMTQPSVEREGCTDMSFVLMRYGTLRSMLRLYVLRKEKGASSKANGFEQLSDGEITSAEKSDFINNLQKEISEKSPRGTTGAEGEKDQFMASVEILERTVEVYRNEEARRRWSWHMQTQILWSPLNDLSTTMNLPPPDCDAHRAQAAMQNFREYVEPYLFSIGGKTRGPQQPSGQSNDMQGVAMLSQPMQTSNSDEWTTPSVGAVSSGSSISNEWTSQFMDGADTSPSSTSFPAWLPFSPSFSDDILNASYAPFNG